MDISDRGEQSGTTLLLEIFYAELDRLNGIGQKIHYLFVLTLRLFDFLLLRLWRRTLSRSPKGSGKCLTT